MIVAIEQPAVVAVQVHTAAEAVAEHTCRSMLHSLEEFANMEFVTFRELTAGFFLGFEHNLWASGCSRNTSAC